MTTRKDDANTAGRFKRPSRKKMIKYGAIALFVIVFFAIAHIYGPYKGKVVDLETGEPIAGAAVLMVFYTETFHGNSAYADAVETLTDADGEFRIPRYLALTFHPLSIWESHGYVTIFKPGYGAYPDHDDVKAIFVPNYSLPENEYVTIQLPRLKTKEEQRLNLGYVGRAFSVPKRKAINLLKLIREEDVNVGLKKH